MRSLRTSPDARFELGRSAYRRSNHYADGGGSLVRGSQVKQCGWEGAKYGRPAEHLRSPCGREARTSELPRRGCAEVHDLRGQPSTNWRLLFQPQRFLESVDRDRLGRLAEPGFVASRAGVAGRIGTDSQAQHTARSFTVFARQVDADQEGLMDHSPHSTAPLLVRCQLSLSWTTIEPLDVFVRRLRGSNPARSGFLVPSPSQDGRRQIARCANRNGPEQIAQGPRCDAFRPITPRTERDRMSLQR